MIHDRDCQKWLELKDAERKATQARRSFEDKFLESLHFDNQQEGSETFYAPRYIIKVTGRMTRSVNGDKLQDIAIENGLVDQLSSLFNWKPSVNMRAWKGTDASITNKLSKAITTKPGRSSISIEEAEK